MRNAAAIRWTVGTVFLALIISAVTFFFLIMPRLDAATEAREMAEQEQARIDQLTIELAGLKRDFENIEEFRAELAALRVQVPTEMLLNELTRQVEGLAIQAEVFPLAITPATPYDILAPKVAAPPPPDPEAEDGEAGDEAEEPATEEGTAPTPQPDLGITLPPGFYAVPVQVTIIGGFDETVTFVENLQTTNPRLVLVNGIVGTVQEQKGAENGRPAVEDGDLETRLDFVAYVLLDSAGQVVEPGTEVETPALPTPGGGAENPFAPLQ